jgi:hypothetical protein
VKTAISQIRGEEKVSKDYVEQLAQTSESVRADLEKKVAETVDEARQHVKECGLFCA